MKAIRTVVGVDTAKHGERGPAGRCGTIRAAGRCFGAPGRTPSIRLSWNEICARAAEFAREWADAAYEKGETQSSDAAEPVQYLADRKNRPPDGRTRRNV